MGNEDFEEVTIGENNMVKDDLTSLIEEELNSNNIKYTSIDVNQIRQRIDLYYNDPDLMLNLDNNTRMFYEKFINITDEKNRKNKDNQMIYTLDDLSGKNGFLNIIFLSILVILLTILVLFIVK